MVKNTLSRRHFVAGSLAALGMTHLAAVPAFATDQPAAQAEPEQVFRSVCRGNCQGCCALDVHVRGGNIVKIERGDFGSPERLRICSRGLSHISRTYSDNRTKFPMKRVGERGSGEFERITWEEAISTIATKWQELSAQYGPQSIMFNDGTGNLCCMNGAIPGYRSVLSSLMNATYLQFCIDFACGVGLSRVVGQTGMNLGASEPTDLINARSIFLWGANITSAQPHDWHYICDAMENGTKLVVVDPNFTHAAAKADLWVPVRPGSDGALYMGIMNRIIAVGGQDEEFLKTKSCAPMLVRKDTGMFLRMSDLGVEPTEGPVNPMTGAPTIINPAVAWDEELGEAFPVEECANPAMHGEFDVQGIACVTAYDLLLERIAEYPLSRVAELTEVPEETIIKMTDIILDKPVSHRVGWGTQAYQNGVETWQAGTTMNILTGNIGMPGACFGAWYDGFMAGINFAYTGAAMGPSTSPNIGDVVLPEILASGKWQGQDYPLKALYISNANPVASASQIKNYEENILSKLDFVVVADTEWSDTCNWADIVLPVSFWFEVEDMLLAGTHGNLMYGEKCIEPLYESKSDAEIFRLLGQALGYGQYMPTEEEYLRAMLDTPMAQAMNISYDHLKQEKTLRFFPTETFVAYEGQVFPTPSGRVEFYVESPAPRLDNGFDLDFTKDRLPHFAEPGEAWPTNPLYEKYPIVFFSERPRFRVHTQWSKTPWLNEIDPEPIAKVNPEDAMARGIADGSYIEVFNDRGHAVAKALYSEGVRPGTLLYPKGWQAEHFKAGSWSELTNMNYDKFGVNQNFMDNLCDYRAWTE